MQEAIRARKLLNSKEIIDDNKRAQNMGVSYGMYKAGLIPEKEKENPYKTSSMGYITKTEPKDGGENNKSAAFIRIKN